MLKRKREQQQQQQQPSHKPPMQLDSDEQYIAAVTARYESLLSLRNGLDFDDLLLKGLVLLRHPHAGPTAASRFSHILVDEFQDSSAIQCALLSNLAIASSASHCPNCTLVGDPNQCIYGWRQADRSNLTTLSKSWPSGSELVRHPLTQSYRSTPNILSVAKQILSSRWVLNVDEVIPPDPYDPPPPDLWTSNPHGPPIAAHLYADANTEACGIAYHISTLLSSTSSASSLGSLSGLVAGGRPMSGGQIAVLARTGRQLTLVRDALKRYNVPCILSESHRLSERKELRPLIAHLQLLLDHTDRDAFERMLKGARGLGDVTIKQLLSDLSGAPPHTSVTPMGLLQQIARNNAPSSSSSSSTQRRLPSKSVISAAQAVCQAHESPTRMLDSGASTVQLFARWWVCWRSRRGRAAHSRLCQERMGGGGFVSASSAAASTSTSAATSGSSSSTAAEGASGAGGDAVELLQQLAAQHDEQAHRLTNGDETEMEEVAAGAGGSSSAESESRRSLRGFLVGLGLGSADGAAGGSSGAEVSLSTLHRSKGLEWRLVFILGCEDEVLPHSRGVREAYAQGGIKAAADVLREERRLLYVGATRAKEGLVLTRAMSRFDEPTRPCPFLRALKPVSDGGECEPSVFLPPSLAIGCRRDTQWAEAELLSGGLPSRWAKAMDRRLEACKVGKPNAHEEGFLKRHYGEDWAERYKVVVPCGDDDVLEEDDEAENAPPPRSSVQNWPATNAHGKAPASFFGVAPSSYSATCSRPAASRPEAAHGGGGFASASTLLPAAGGIGGHGSGGGGRLLGGRARGGTMLGGGGMLSGGGGGMLSSSSSAQGGGQGANRAFKMPRPIGR